jgi:mRNA-degrading endonuclease YafQ of YafQ-DinJ toxin-antitoxin module
MQTIERTGQFKLDFKREAKGPHRATLQLVRLGSHSELGL